MPVPGVTAAFSRQPVATYRNRSLRQTFRSAWRERHRMGVTRLADLTELDRLGIPVAAAVRPAVHSAQITMAQGKGLAGLDAIVSALMEAVERWAAAQPRSTFVASQQELLQSGVAFIHPAALGGSPPASDAQIEWIEASAIGGPARYLVPASDVLFPYYPRTGCVSPTRPCTSGLASGNDLTEAILYGLFEVIERAATSTAIAHGALRRVEPADIPDVERGILARFDDAGIRTLVCELVGAALPTYSAFTFDAEWLGPKMVIGGQGTHLIPRIALRRALLEAAQSRIVAIQGSREDLIRHSHQWDLSVETGRHHCPERDSRSRWQFLCTTPSMDYPSPG